MQWWWQTVPSSWSGTRKQNVFQTSDAYAFCDTSCTSGFVDDVMLKVTHRGQHQWRSEMSNLNRLSSALQKDEESARDNHVLARNFASYSPISQKITDRFSNKPFLIWLLTTAPCLKYVATLPCNLSLIACFLTLMFHKVVRHHMQGVVEFLVTIML